MKRIYKGSDLEFNLTVNNLPLNIVQIASLEFNFYTLNRNNRITKTKKDITENNTLILQWNELQNLEQGVLYFDYKYSINNPDLVDNSYDEINNTMTDYYIVSNKAELDLDIPQIDWGSINGDILDQSDLISYIDVQIKNVNINNYYTKQQIEDKKYLTSKDIENKVDKSAGKSLVEDTEIARLKTLKNYDDSAITRDLNSVKTNKVDKVSGKSLIADSEINRLKTVTNYDDTTIKSDIKDIKSNKQDTLVNGETIKMINGKDILGAGNLKLDQIYIGTEVPTDPNYVLWINPNAEPTPEEIKTRPIPNSTIDQIMD